jgi:hypothetical protein
LPQEVRLENRDWISWGPGGPDDGQWREDIGENPGPALDQALEGHALMKVDSILHDEVLVARMKDLRIDRRHDFDGEIVRADNADLQTRKPTCAFKSDAGLSVVEGFGFGVPSTSMPVRTNTVSPGVIVSSGTP